MPRSSRFPANAVRLGLASHVLAGLLPFISAGAIGRLGLMPGTAALYVAGLLMVTLGLLNANLRSTLSAESRVLFANGTRGAFVSGLAGFLLAGIAYYIGLFNSPRVAEYVFLTRLDWLVQAPVAILLLKEPWTRRGLAGGVLALAGGILLAWSGSIGFSGLTAAAVYILASLVGYSFFKHLSATRGMDGAVALTVWRHWVNTAGFVLLAFLVTGLPRTWPTSGLLLAAAAGVVLVILFLLRFAALTRIPLWVLAVQAPTQALVAVVVTFATAGSLPSVTLAAIAMIVVGEVAVTASRPAIN